MSEQSVCSQYSDTLRSIRCQAAAVSSGAYTSIYCYAYSDLRSIVLGEDTFGKGVGT